MKLFGYPKEISDKDISHCLKQANYNANRVHQFFLLKSNSLTNHASFDAWHTSLEYIHYKYDVVEWTPLLNGARVDEKLQQETVIHESVHLYCFPNNFPRAEVVGSLEESSRDANSVYQYYCIKFYDKMKYDSYKAWRASVDYDEDYQIWFHWPKEEVEITTTVGSIMPPGIPGSNTISVDNQSGITEQAPVISFDINVDNGE